MGLCYRQIDPKPAQRLSQRQFGMYTPSRLPGKSNARLGRRHPPPNQKTERILIFASGAWKGCRSTHMHGLVHLLGTIRCEITENFCDGDPLLDATTSTIRIRHHTIPVLQAQPPSFVPPSSKTHNGNRQHTTKTRIFPRPRTDMTSSPVSPFKVRRAGCLLCGTTPSAPPLETLYGTYLAWETSCRLNSLYLSFSLHSSSSSHVRNGIFL